MSLVFDHGPTMSDGEFRSVRDLINRFCGLAFDDGVRFVVERRLRERLKALGCSDFSEYEQHLRGHREGRAELGRAVDLLTTNETYFFRERQQLHVFERVVLPALAEANATRRRLTLWSAGCSTGEEVYTLAMIVASMPRLVGWDVRIFGSDINRGVLERARRGVYREASFRAMPGEYLRFFEEHPDGRAVRPEIRASCHFGHLNLLERAKVIAVGAVDAIFCRNVLIYFDTKSRARVVTDLGARLVPGGYLLLGHSESLPSGVHELEVVLPRRDMVYRRPVTSARVAPAEARHRGRAPRHVVVVGASTGGPSALVELFRRLPSDLDATVLAAQHMPPRFTQTFAERLDRLGGLRVRQATDHHPLVAGEAWVCPGGHCLEVSADGMVRVVASGPDDRHAPSVDRLFETAARRLRERVVGVVLTGMGDDGAKGTETIARLGGRVVAQSPQSAMIAGIPRAAIATGGVERALTSVELADHVAGLVGTI